MDSEYKLIPLGKTQSIPVNWKLSKGDYDKLVKGYRSNWAIFLRNDTVHICRVGGEEFYRFRINENRNNTYTVNSLETYVLDKNFVAKGSEAQLKESNDEFVSLAQDEVVGLLINYFAININKT